jgi:hypothetical protein
MSLFARPGIHCSGGRRWRAPDALIVAVVGRCCRSPRRTCDDTATPTGAPRRSGSSFQQGSATVSAAFSSEMDARSELRGLDGTIADDPAPHPGSIEIDRDDQDLPLRWLDRVADPRLRLLRGARRRAPYAWLKTRRENSRSSPRTSAIARIGASRAKPLRQRK